MEMVVVVAEHLVWDTLFYHACSVSSTENFKMIFFVSPFGTQETRLALNGQALSLGEQILLLLVCFLIKVGLGLGIWFLHSARIWGHSERWARLVFWLKRIGISSLIMDLSCLVYYLGRDTDCLFSQLILLDRDLLRIWWLIKAIWWPLLWRLRPFRLRLFLSDVEHILVVYNFIVQFVSLLFFVQLLLQQPLLLLKTSNSLVYGLVSVLSVGKLLLNGRDLVEVILRTGNSLHIEIQNIIY